MPITRRKLLFSAALGSIVFPARKIGAKMFEPTSVAENLMYCTARLVGTIPASTNFKTGTGFFFSFPLNPNEQIPVLVTNKHVIEGTEKLQFLIHTSSTSDAKQPDGNAAIDSVATDWIAHPNPKVDLCALGIGQALNSMGSLTPFFRSLDPTIIKSDDELKNFNAVEDVLMVGYPNGLWDSTNNYPLIRRGITASHPSIDFDVDGVATTVVDVASFPGSSGSPVLIYNNGAIIDKKGNTTFGSRAILLGVLYSGPTFQADGSIVIRNIPTGNVAVPQLNMMMNLGYVIKAKEILELGKALFARHSFDWPSEPIMPSPEAKP